MTLAKTYRRTGYERAAVACCKEVVRDCPYAVDAIAALAELGCSGEEIRGLLPECDGSDATGTSPRPPWGCGRHERRRGHLRPAAEPS